jgi:hypothetical protein
MIVGFVLPEGLSGAPDDFVRFPRRDSFDPFHDVGGRRGWLHEQMNMIAHYHPRGDFAQAPLVRRSKHLRHHVSDFRVFEPHWTSVGCIELAIRFDECFTRCFLYALPGRH